LLFHEKEESGAKGTGGFGGGSDNQHGIVAGDGSRDLGPFRVIESGSEGIGVSGRSAQDEKILGDPHIEQELAGDGIERRDGRRGRAGSLRVAFRSFDQAELTDVARESDLSGGDTLGPEGIGEFFLSVEMASADQLEDLTVTIGF
jgi:hypothetical protein